jgi:DnaJ domain
MIESACNGDRLVSGPAAYYHCLASQLAALEKVPGRPDLSGLSSEERGMVQSACHGNRLVNGPASYYGCISRELASLAPGKTTPSARPPFNLEPPLAAPPTTTSPAKVSSSTASDSAIVRPPKHSPGSIKPEGTLIPRRAAKARSGITIGEPTKATTSIFDTGLSRNEALPAAKPPTKEEDPSSLVGVSIAVLLVIVAVKFLAKGRQVKCPRCGAQVASAGRCRQCREDEARAARESEERRRRAEENDQRQERQHQEREHRNEDRERGRQTGTHKGGPLRDPYAVLGLRPGATQAEIRAAYRNAMAKYHPDKVSHLGIELQELAKAKALEINEAHEALSR